LRQKIVAAIGAIATIGLFLLANAKRLADAISIVHLPHDVGEVLTSMSQTPTLISNAALAVGLICLAYLGFSHWRPKTNPSNPAGPIAPISQDGKSAFDPGWSRNVSLSDGLWRAFSGTWGGRIQLDTSLTRQTKKFLEAASEIRQRAFEGTLPVWGRRPASTLYEPIPSEFWRNHAIAAGYSISSTEGDIWVYVTRPLVVGDVPNARTPVWKDFMTSREAVEKIWPEVIG
jgi:hypothetical protein